MILFISQQNSLKSKLLIISTIKISKRFTGDRVGHAKKILEAANKAASGAAQNASSTFTNKPSQSPTVVQSNDIKPSPTSPAISVTSQTQDQKPQITPKETSGKVESMKDKKPDILEYDKKKGFEQEKKQEESVLYSQKTQQETPPKYADTWYQIDQKNKGPSKRIVEEAMKPVTPSNKIQDVHDISQVTSSNPVASSSVSTFSISTYSFPTPSNSEKLNFTPTEIDLDATINSELTPSFTPIPVTPLLPIQPLVKPITGLQAKSFTTEIQNFKKELLKHVEVQETTEIVVLENTVEQKLQLVSKYGLVDLEEGKVKSEFYKYHANNYKKDKEAFVNIPENPQIKIGLLAIKNAEDSVLLAGHQMHVTVLFIDNNGQKVVWAYLTSEKNKIDIDNYLLFKKQAFEDPLQPSSKEQRIKIFKQPFIVENDDLSELKPEIQQKGNNFIKDNEVAPIIIQLLKDKVSPKLKQPLRFYEAIGITEKNLDHVIMEYEKDHMKKAEKYFSTYKQKKGTHVSEKKIQDWLLHIKQVNPHTYTLLLDIIEKRT